MGIVKDDSGTVRYFADAGQTVLHRLDGPAVIHPDEREEWWIYGSLLPENQMRVLADRLHFWLRQHPPKINWGAAGPHVVWGGEPDTRPDLSPSAALNALASRADLEPWLKTRLKAIADQCDSR